MPACGALSLQRKVNMVSVVRVCCCDVRQWVTLNVGGHQVVHVSFVEQVKLHESGGFGVAQADDGSELSRVRGVELQDGTSAAAQRCGCCTGLQEVAIGLLTQSGA